MVYREKVQECKAAAELCFHNGKYNSAANRFYYCLYLLAKGILQKNGFDYNGFLKNSPNLSPWKRRHKQFSHDTIYFALMDYLHFATKKIKKHETHDFQRSWNNVLYSRITADYEDDHISEEYINKCRDSFTIVWERIHNELTE